jgi:hypothetical protein
MTTLVSFGILIGGVACQTRIISRQFSTIFYHNFGDGNVSTRSLGILNLSDDGFAFDHTSEYDVLAVQVPCWNGSNKKLRVYTKAKVEPNVDGLRMVSHRWY